MKGNIFKGPGVRTGPSLGTITSLAHQGTLGSVPLSALTRGHQQEISESVGCHAVPHGPKGPLGQVGF